ncbi:hypothetical protein BJ912DRAFT_1133663 [Pholiota molesta]|nr:hypothetical protein BJ912DRAFT_1133663 [Pholiota molesta]
MDHHQLQLQIPHFVYGNTLVDGGGAELINPDWFPVPVGPNEFDYPPVDSAHESSANPFDYPLPVQPVQQQPLPAAHPPPPDLSIFLAGLPPPAPLGLPVYSASGFDLLSILARIASRPAPRIALGPVDFTCAFVVVDVRRFDHPVVYCSPAFCALTGYAEREVLGRNCRFLQAPGGRVGRGEPRAWTSPEAVAHLRRSLGAGKECQTSIVNYKKGGAAFVNLVTVIPVPEGEREEAVYQVGFQVDLTEQPNAILEKLRDGSYLVNYASVPGVQQRGAVVQVQVQAPPVAATARDRKANAIPPLVMSKDLRRMLADPAFLRSIPLTLTSTHPTPSTSSADDPAASGAGHALSLLLLEAAPDFIHVVSIKGEFQYVAPSVRRVLGYEAAEMVGTSIASYAHPEDVVPLLRELKDSSASSSHPTSSSSVNTIHENATSQLVPQLHHTGQPQQRGVALLFRARTKMGRYVWVECRGRLLAEPGKGKKAVVLAGRAREMLRLPWADVRAAGGLARGMRVPVGGVGLSGGTGTEGGGRNGGGGRGTDGGAYREQAQEVWGTLGGACRATAAFLSVGRGAPDVLGWAPDALRGRALASVLCDEGAADALGGFVASMRAYQRQQRSRGGSSGPGASGGSGGGVQADPARVMKTRCALRRRDGARVDVWFVLYRADAEPEPDAPPQTVLPARDAGASITPAPLVFQIRVADALTIMPGAAAEGGGVQLEGSVPSLSSLAGAVPPLFPGGAPAAADALLEDDMFDALAVARGSSWQYELQQLRITNLRLREELAALEAAEAAAGVVTVVVDAPQPAQGMGYEAGLYEPQQQQHQLHPHPRVYADPAPPPPPPLFTSQPQHAHRDPYPQQLHYDYEPPPSLPPLPPPPATMVPYLHQPVPHAQYVVPPLPRPPRCETPQEWNTGPTPGYGSGLKRAWSAIDGA